MAPEELHSRIKGLDNLVTQLGKRETSALAELDTLYRAAFGEGFVESCKNCVNKAFHKLQALTLDNLIAMAEQKFKLKKGIVVQFPAFSPNMYTAANMTDFVAKQYLHENPDGLQFFDAYPEDWKEKEEAPDQPETARELIAKIKVADTIEVLNELVTGSENRETVIKAKTKRIEELNKAAADEKELIAKINVADTIEVLNELVTDDDERDAVIEAKTKRIEELNKPAV